MKMTLSMKVLISLLVVCMISTTNIFSQRYDKNSASADVAAKLSSFKPIYKEFSHLGAISVDSVSVKKKNINLYFSTPLSYIPMREWFIESLYADVKDSLGTKYHKYSVTIFSDKKPIQTLIPNLYRNSINTDAGRVAKAKSHKTVVSRVDGVKPSNGLLNKNIALWHSHGWYYESSLDRWEWQRTRLFGYVEDLGTMSYVIPFLVPMLENAGASVFVPRERDVQNEEVVVDNDRSTPESEFIVGSINISSPKAKGFLLQDTIFTGVNPFKSGSSLAGVATSDDAVFTYLPHFNKRGEYAVYVSFPYQTNNQKVMYDVVHLGGVTTFEIDQSMSAATWVYLGRFQFDAGKNVDKGAVILRASAGSNVAADAVRFGGGMGNVARTLPAVVTAKKTSVSDRGVDNQYVRSGVVAVNNWQTSGRARFTEGARYYLQYAGAPEAVYNLNKNSNDYNDDYMSRGEWVNYLMGASQSPNGGLNIPVDMAFAFHTDAGTTPNDSVIGTLAIFSTVRNSGTFSNGRSKMSSRDLADVVQSQIINDVRSLYNPDWVRRGLWDRQYSEAWRPDVPTMLLELLSHQNMGDMKYGLDPRFRFDVSRAIYKGILRFMADNHGFNPVVQPLPINQLAVQCSSTDEVKLSWQAVPDPLEPGAMPHSYKVYTRIDDGGFDNGVVVYDNFCNVKLETGKIYSFKVTAINDGGESFPSEILAAGIASGNAPRALVVNKFDRICAPSFVDKDDFAGLAWWEDAGVPYKDDFSYVGNQYDFNRNSQWLDDDSPGWGASNADMEGTVIAGNTFDYAYTHGKALMANGWSFASASDEAFEQPGFDISEYKMVDVILGEQKTTPQQYDKSKVDFKIYTPSFMSKIGEAASSGKNILLSGAYVGTDLVLENDSAAIDFAARVLHFKWRTNHASSKGVFKGAVSGFAGNYSYSNLPNDVIYCVESPDGIEPADKSGNTIFRYGDNNVSAGVAWKGSYGVVVLGVPFETIVDEDDASEIMKNVIGFFDIR